MKNEMEMLVKAVVVRETEKALNVEVLIGDDRKSKIWVPKSQCEVREDGSIWATSWIIDQKEREVCNGYDGAHIETSREMTPERIAFANEMEAKYGKMKAFGEA